ncbi:serine hydrolase [Rugosimonospora acidiphila]|uniref:Serine hydrolase n=1 Tax=Rugosimonospora acidiphila TaxID=556531 RepID=A0ABP9SFM5_9ACTN
MMREAMDAYVERGEIPGIVTATVRGGEVEINELGTTSLGGSDAMRSDTIFRVASMTKPVVAVAAMTLVEDGVLGLDDAVDDHLPELADRRVLRRPDGPLDDTVPAARPITLRDLLTFRMGFGMSPAVPLDAPIMVSASERQVNVAPPKTLPELTAREWLARFGELPLMFQPGEQWAYHTSATVLGILISRAAGRKLDDYLRERVFAPLEMRDSGFAVPAGKRDRFATQYGVDPDSGKLVVFDGPGDDSKWAQVPPSPDGGADLLSTVDDYLAFARMLASGGGEILSPASVSQMITDQLAPGQSTFDPGTGWGFGMSVMRSGEHAGEYGWSGGTGTCWFNDPAADLVAILLTQRMWDSPQPPPVVRDFVAAAYAG